MMRDPFEPWQLRVLSPEEFAALGTPEGDVSPAQLRHLAAYNLLAPTSHNTVPQRFLFPKEGNSIELWLDRKVVLAASDPSGRQATISVGCGITHLREAARRYGLEAAVEVCEPSSSPTSPYASGQSRYTRVARVRFRRGGAATESDAVLRAMLERRSVRADYNVSVALPAQLSEALTGLMASQYPELGFHLVSDAPTMDFLADLQERSDSEALSRVDFTGELGHWLVDNDSDSVLGMRGREYGMSDALTRGVRARLLSDVPLTAEDVSALAHGASVHIRSSSAVGIIVAPRDELRQRVLAGCALAELVLTLQQHAFVTAMHAAIPEVEGAHRALSARLGASGRPIVVFRTGQPLEPRDARRAHSARPSVSDLTLAGSGSSSPPADTTT